MRQIAWPLPGEAHVQIDRKSCNPRPDGLRRLDADKTQDAEREEINRQNPDTPLLVEDLENGKRPLTALLLLEQVADEQKAGHHEKQTHSEWAERDVAARPRHQMMEENHEARDAAQGIELVEVVFRLGHGFKGDCDADPQRPRRAGQSHLTP